MLQFAIPCLLGLESLVGDEVKKLGLADVKVENGRPRAAEHQSALRCARAARARELPRDGF